MDEHPNSGAEEREEDEDRKRDERYDRDLTQRELVRASLLRCPPPERSEPPRH